MTLSNRPVIYRPHSFVRIDLGRRMTVPQRFQWTVTDADNAPVLALDCIVDTPLRYGHGRGYVGAYTFHGMHLGKPVDGSGYLEWVDTQRTPIALSQPTG
ncbi:hypothetical protein BA059_01590 [Mycolicibacterium sp. (ex Dasyatis americana)]|nr:hypothetical protein BA059_01590 [Mycolicibacterium sp. (ex Dasyatis americana)]